MTCCWSHSYDPNQGYKFFGQSNNNINVQPKVAEPGNNDPLPMYIAIPVMKKLDTP